MIIDSSYFTKGRRHIENASSADVLTPTKSNIAVHNAITAYIEEYGPQFLNEALGKDLAKRIMENEGDDTSLSALISGLREPMADYVMYYILRYSQRPTLDGVVRLKCANIIVSPAVYQANVWNSMVDGLRRLQEDLPEIRVNQCLLEKMSSCWI